MSPPLFRNPQSPLPQIQQRLPLQLPHLGNTIKQIIPIHFDFHNRKKTPCHGAFQGEPISSDLLRLALSTFIVHGYQSNQIGAAFVLIMHFLRRKPTTNHSLLTIHAHNNLHPFVISTRITIRSFLHRPLKSCPGIGNLGYSLQGEQGAGMGSSMKGRVGYGCRQNLPYANDSVNIFGTGRWG